MITELCQELHNWFETAIYDGRFSVTEGNLNADFLQNGQFFRIVGSIYNDGVYQYPTNELVEEEFEGTVWAMAVPKAVIALAEEIDAWNTKYGAGVNSPFQSESFGGYSYAKGTTASGKAINGWQDAFASRLNRWRKI